jgi:hypothetical protein
MFETFDKKLRKICIEDRADDCIYYEDTEAQEHSMRLRLLTCLIRNCNHSSQEFPNVASLQRHLEQVHSKTFCKICL